MIGAPTINGVQPLVVRLEPVIKMTAEDFARLCQLNPELRLELTEKGDVIAMSPAGGETGNRNLAISAALYVWTISNGEGAGFDSSTGFVLPNGAIRSPDAAWVRREQLSRLTPAQKQRFLPLCPDFVLELRSASDRLSDLQEKMEEYIANGARLGWLIVPETRSVYVYRPGRAPQYMQDISTLSGDPELPGFVLDLTPIWKPL
jgi:Uma2 family endonuclease